MRKLLTVLAAPATPSLRGAFLLVVFLVFAFPAGADVTVPQLTGPVVDQTRLLRGGEIASLTKKLRDFERSKGRQIAVLIVPTTKPETIEQFSIRVADAWKIGRQGIGDGAILVFAFNHQLAHIAVGHALEGALTDTISSWIIHEELIPRFRQGDLAGGISAAVDRMISVINGEPLPAPKFSYWQDDLFTGIVVVLVFLVLCMFFVAIGMFRYTFGVLVGSVVNSGTIGLVVWWISASEDDLLQAIFHGFLFTLLAGVQFVPGLAKPGIWADSDTWLEQQWRQLWR